MSKLNVEALRQIQALFREEPDKCHMESWASYYPNGCGTVGCIAGWAIMFQAIKDGRYTCKDRSLHHVPYACSPAGTGAELLGLSGSEADTLFFPGNWPEPFMTRWADGDQKQKAAVTCEMIEHIIQQHSK